MNDDPTPTGEKECWRLMGHSNIATTTRYLHLVDADLLDAVDRAYPES